MKLKDVLIEGLQEREVEEGFGDTVKKGLAGAAIAGGLMMANPSQTPAPTKATQQAAKINQQITKAKIDPNVTDRPHILAAIKAVESAGGKLLNHEFMDSGPHAGERAIGPYAFLPSTAFELISKDKGGLKKKYGSILSLSWGNFEQSEVEEFMQNHPRIHEDLANHYIDQILKRTSAKTAGEISQAWLYGIKGFNKQKKAGKPMKSDRFNNAQNAYAQSKQKQGNAI
jgi:hypothetical protein